MERNTDEIEIDLRELFNIIRKRMLLIALIVVISVITVSILSFFVLDKEYEASTSLIVGNSSNYNNTDKSSLEYDQVMMYQKLIKTFSEIAKSRMISEKVIGTLKLNYTVQDLQNRIEITSVGDTQMINITVRDNDPKLAADIANEIALIFKNEVAKIMKVDNIEVIDVAKVPKSPVQPKSLLNIAIALAASFILGIGLCLLLEYLDQTIKTPEDVEKYLELPVIGAIPDITHVN